MNITVYTDGACSGNPGAGGWGVFIILEQETKKLHGGVLNTTNNQMELTAVIKALSYIDDNYTTPIDAISIYTDSQYVKNGITTWIKTWEKNGWKNSANKPVKNKQLWLMLQKLTNDKNILWNWVKGHNGNEYNELVDSLARSGIAELS